MSSAGDYETIAWEIVRFGVYHVVVEERLVWPNVQMFPGDRSPLQQKRKHEEVELSVFTAMRHFLGLLRNRDSVLEERIL